MNPYSCVMRSVVAIVGLCTVVRAQTFTSTVDHVAVPVTIHSGPGVPDLELGPQDFRVFDAGRQVPIVSFGRLRQPVHVLLLLDASRSMTGSLAEVRTAARAVIARLESGDTVRVGTFSSMLRLSPVFSADDHRLVSRLAIEPGANMTLLYDALVEACSAFSGEMARRVIFVVSDGTDTSSVASPRTVLQRAAEADVAIHAVGLASRYVERGRPVVRMPDAILRDLAEDTGGGYVYAGTGRDYARLFGAMIEQLRQQYMLGFTPARADGRVHTLMVTTRRPDVTIRARKHYLAPLP